MSKSKSGIKYEMGSGNVFADIGLPNPEEHLLKARLARLINKAVKEKGWTQQHTAEVLGITQPKVSDMGRGRLKNFSVERLLGFLAQLDHRVAITVSRADLPPEEFVIAANSLSGEQSIAR
jgi:predicted XRE-type DNA-binding protein